MVYGLGSETTGGWCLPEAQLAWEGIQVARAVYDTLTVPDANGDFKPYLAESITPNDSFTEFTIKLRPGITFHDGTPLDATVVKNNLDAFRGAYPARRPLLFTFVFANVTDVSVVDPMTVKVTAKTPWPAFPAYLFAWGRAGIMAQAQLDDPDNCETNLIGTGPFKLKEWTLNERFVAERNQNYWQKDADGQQLPYLDEIEFRPYSDGDVRVNALLSGEINTMHAANAGQIGVLRSAAEGDEVELIESDDFAEVSFVMLNSSRPPFDNLNARLALAYSVDRESYVEVRSVDPKRIASGPFAPGEVGYLEDTGFPEFDLDKAREHVQRYEQETGRALEFTLSSTPDPATVQAAQLIQEHAERVGATVHLAQAEAAALINTALAGDFDAVLAQNHPGGDPDLQYVWWYGGSPVNFGRFDDPEINRLLDAGRQEPDPDKAKADYEELNRRFGEQAYNLWLNWVNLGVATAPEVGGVYGPDLPDGSKPFPGLSGGHALLGMYVED